MLSDRHLSLRRILTQARTQHQTIVLATVVFDVLHPEHLKFLRAAKKIGEVLIVGLESDERVARIKGPGRPVHSQLKRQNQLEKLRIAQAVIVLPSRFDCAQDHLNFLKQIQPDILAVSAHSPHLAVKKRLMAQIGGRVEIVRQFNPNFSSTKLIRRSQKQPNFKSVQS